VKVPGNSPISAADGLFVGEDQRLDWTIYGVDQEPQDITGWTITFKLATSQTATAAVTKTATLTTPAGGLCSVSLAAADTSGLTPGRWYYTLARTNAGNNQVLAYGNAVLQGRPT